MDLRQSLAHSLATRHPLEAAAALESRPAEEIAGALKALPPGTAAAVLMRFPPGVSAQSVERLDEETAVCIVAALETDKALLLLRRVKPEVRDAITRALPDDRVRALKAVMRFSAGTAGALMDPLASALPVDMEAGEAIKAVRREAEHAHDTLYVIDRDHKLVGVLNLRDLLLAQPKDRLETIMQEARNKLSPAADRYAMIRHPGWPAARSLPVVDRDGRFLGAIHHRVIREVEDELRQSDAGPGETAARALGDLFWAGVGGVLEAFTAAVSPPKQRPTRRSGAPANGERRPAGTGSRHVRPRETEE